MGYERACPGDRHHRLRLRLLGMAIRLKQSGFHDFTVLEKSEALGGTWHDNTYPGCACDVPSHMYSFSFELNHGWTRMFAPQPEIRSTWSAPPTSTGSATTSGSARPSTPWSTTTTRSAGT